MQYNTDSKIIRHVINLLEQIFKKYITESKDIFVLIEAKKILLNLADKIDKENE